LADDRPVKEAEFILETNGTVRSTAKHFGVSKSTVHLDVTKKLKEIDEDLYIKVRNLLFINLSERHIRGGMATREKYVKGK
jgi:putative DeoR family transcriptional regulator (stage III sporulation protein D)